jgi:hypothetical protein
MLGFKMELLMTPVTLLDGDLYAIRCITENIMFRGGDMLPFTENFQK